MVRIHMGLPKASVPTLPEKIHIRDGSYGVEGNPNNGIFPIIVSTMAKIAPLAHRFVGALTGGADTTYVANEL